MALSQDQIKAEALGPIPYDKLSPEAKYYRSTGTFQTTLDSTPYDKLSPEAKYYRSTGPVIDTRTKPGGLRAEVFTSSMASGLTKVPTSSTGPGGETIFDVFSGAEHIADPNDPRLKGINISGLPTGQAPEGFQSKFLPIKTEIDSGIVSDTTLPRAKVDKTKSELEAGLAEMGIEKPTDAGGVSDTVKEILAGIKTRQAELKTEAEAEQKRIEKEFATASEEVKFAQEQERKKKEQKTFYKGYVFKSEIEELDQLDRQHRMENAALLSKKNSALAAATKAFRADDFELSQAQLKLAKGLEDTQYKKEQDYFDNIIKLQERYDKLNKPLRDLETKQQDQVLEWMEKAPDAFSDVEPIDLELGTFSFGEARARWIQSDVYKREQKFEQAKLEREQRLARGEGVNGKVKVTPSVGFFSGDVEADIREDFVGYKQAGKTSDETYVLLRDLYSPQEVSDTALKNLIGIKEPEDIPPSAEETSQSWLGSLFSAGGVFNPMIEVPIQEKPIIEKGLSIFTEKEKGKIKGGFKKLFGKGGFFNPNIKQ